MTSFEERVILVDSDDHDVGTREKIAAHQRGELHRAVSAFVFDCTGRHLLQRRAAREVPLRWALVERLLRPPAAGRVARGRRGAAASRGNGSRVRALRPVAPVHLSCRAGRRHGGARSRSRVHRHVRGHARSRSGRGERMALDRARRARRRAEPGARRRSPPWFRAAAFPRFTEARRSEHIDPMLSLARSRPPQPGGELDDPRCSPCSRSC